MYSDMDAKISVRDVMTADPITVRPQTDIVEAISLMLEAHAGALPVVDRGGKLLGMVTGETMIHRMAGRLSEEPPGWLRSFLFPGSLALKFAHLHGKHVIEILNTSLGSLRPSISLKDATVRLDETGSERLAVVEHDHVVGVVTRANVMKMVLKLVCQANGAARTDGEIEAQVKAALMREPWMPRHGVSVAVDKGHAHLRGFLLEDRLRYGIRAVVENVPGVTKVHDLGLASVGSDKPVLSPEDLRRHRLS